MARLGRLAGVLVLLGWVAAGPALAQPAPASRAAPAAGGGAAPFARSFVRADLASAAVRLEAALKARGRRAARGRPASPAPPGRPCSPPTRPTRRSRPFAAAVAADPADVRNWQAYSRAAAGGGRATLEDKDYEGRARLRGRAPAAAYRAYERAGTAADAAAALALLGAAEAGQAILAPGPRRLRGEPRAGRRAGGARDLRGAAGRARLPHPRLQGRFRRGRPARVLHLLGGAEPKTDYAPFVAVSGSSAAAVTAEGSQVCVDGLEARRPLRLRAAPGPALGGRREPAQGRRLRDLRARPRPAGALHRAQLRPAPHRTGGRAPGLGERGQARRRGAAHRRPRAAADPALRGFPRPAQRRDRPDDRRPRRACGSGRAPSTPPRPS